MPKINHPHRFLEAKAKREAQEKRENELKNLSKTQQFIKDLIKPPDINNDKIVESLDNIQIPSWLEIEEPKYRLDKEQLEWIFELIRVMRLNIDKLPLNETTDILFKKSEDIQKKILNTIKIREYAALYGITAADLKFNSQAIRGRKISKGRLEAKIRNEQAKIRAKENEKASELILRNNFDYSKILTKPVVNENSKDFTKRLEQFLKTTKNENNSQE